MAFKPILAATLLVSTVAVTAYAGGHAGNPAVKARKAHMQLYAHYLGVVGGMAKGEVEYNAESASAAANNLAALTALDQRTYWVPGTSNAELGDETRLLPAAFEADSKAIEISMQLAEAAVGLAAVAGDGQAALGPALGPVGTACGACHEAYQQPR